MIIGSEGKKEQIPSTTRQTKTAPPMTTSVCLETRALRLRENCVFMKERFLIALRVLGHNAGTAHHCGDGRKCTAFFYGPRHPLRGLAIGGNGQPLRQHGALESDDRPAGGECLGHRREHAHPGRRQGAADGAGRRGHARTIASPILAIITCASLSIMYRSSVFSCVRTQ